jgi:3-mercaptopyruvate sulfurtransferase SseA
MTGRLFIQTALGLAVAALLLAACKASDSAGNSRADSAASQTAAKPAQAQAPSDARRVTVAELQKMIEDGEAVIYDTRAKGAYDREHIKGSRSMPYGEVDSRVAELPKDKTIVFYCT